jgi:hypothetical protein
MTKSLYTAIFEDDSYFHGGQSYLDTKWTDMPHKKIKRLFYKLPDGNYLCLREYDNYYHMIEATKALTGKDKGKIKLECVHIFGKRGNIINRYSIILSNSGRGNILKKELQNLTLMGGGKYE